MPDIGFESAIEIVTLAVELLVAVLLTITGIAAEGAGVSRLGVGVDVLTLWYVGIGALALYVGIYMLGYRTILPKVRS